MRRDCADVCMRMPAGVLALWSCLDGLYVTFGECVERTRKTRLLLADHQIVTPSPPVRAEKRQGDGAAMSRRYKNLTTIAVCLITDRRSLTPSKLHPIVTWAGKEDTESIRAACGDIIPVINDMVRDKGFTVMYNNEEVKVHCKVSMGV